MRLFVAIELPIEVKNFLSELNSELAQIKGVRTVSKETTHLTLLFLGDKNNVADVISTLNLLEFRTFELSLSSFGFFPNNNTRKISWMGVNHSKDLMMLQKQIASLFQNSNEYIPHITYARMKYSSSVLIKQFDKVLSEFRNKTFRFKVDKFKLFSSELTKLGPIHRVVESFSSKE